MRSRFFIIIILWCCAGEQQSQGDERFFRQRIEPVLKRECFGCHSAAGKSAKGGLRLDSRAALRAGGESGAVIVAGNAAQSLLMQALQHDDLKMPPAKRLSDKVLKDFATWINAGAIDPRAESDKPASGHWAFQPISNPTPPPIHDPWIQNDVDRFVLQKLRERKWTPSPLADKRTLIRRVYLDLIGLLPTEQQVQTFLNNPNEDAWEQVIDALLASPQYGERWGRHWLDVARYADSNGYEADLPRPHAWRWRDWVIHALNTDMPFDQFTVEQLAGDLLPDATIAQQLATGFHRNTLFNTEGGVDREEDRVKRTVDRTNTLGQVWLGLTLKCCQCHAHKYDPISQHEYYSLYAFFNSLNESLIAAPTAAEQGHFQQQLAAYQRQRRQYLQEIAQYDSPALKQWASRQTASDQGWVIVNPSRLHSAVGANLQLQDDLSVFVTSPNDHVDTYTITTTTRLDRISGIRIEAMADPRLPQKGPGLAGNGNFVLSSVRVFAKPVTQGADASSRGKGIYVPLETARANFSQGGRQVTSVLGDDPHDGWAVYPRVGETHTAVFEFKDLITLKSDPGAPIQLTIELDHQLHPDHNLGRFRVALTSADQPIPTDLADTGLFDILNKPDGQRTGEDIRRLVRFHRFQEPALDRILAKLQAFEKTRPVAPETLSKARVVSENSPHRKTQIHRRGDFLDKGDAVQRRTPAVLPPLMTQDHEPTRLDLARWLVAENHPLTSRVIVNRVWQRHFGSGLVASEDDFGTQGESPTHPQLLDWLATRFRQDGWSFKSLHRQIVTSASYRQSSKIRPEILDADPTNQWLARQSRLRVEAEIIRDVALQASGLLQQKVGGRSVYPPQPDDLVKLGFQTSQSWPTSLGEDRYRRGLYTFFRRTNPYPMLIQFDSTDANASCTRRDRSTTPTQALTLWNDPVFFECAQALGRRLLSESDHRDIVSRAFQLCLSRNPSPIEHRTLTQFYQSRLARFRADEQATNEFLGNTTATRWLRSELAAAISLGRTMLNLDEFITRE